MFGSIQMAFPPHLWIQAPTAQIADTLGQRIQGCDWSWIASEESLPESALGMCLLDCRHLPLSRVLATSIPTLWLVTPTQVPEAETALAQGRMHDYILMRQWDGLALSHHWARIQGQRRHSVRDTSLLHSLQGLQDLLFVLDPDLRYQKIYGTWAPRLLQMGYDIVGKTLEEFSSPEQVALHMYYQRQALAGQQVDYYWENDGLGLYFYFDLRPLRNEAGDIIGVVGVGRDIAELKQTELQLKHILEDKEVLLQETYHRVKNNLQVISSMLNLQARQAADPVTLSVLRETQNRILAMALIHEKLYESGALAQIPFASYIRDLATQLLQAYPQPGARITFGCDSLNLSIDPALLGGLILNELVSNCLRHAFAPQMTDGEVHISLRAVAGSPDYVLAIRDNGRGFPPDLDISYPRTVGLRLVRRLAQQLGGNLEVRTGMGTEVRVRFKPY